MEIMTAAEAKQKFGQLLDKAQRGPVQITKNGRPSCYVVSSEDYEAEQAEKEACLKSELSEARAQIEAGMTHAASDVRERVMSKFETK